MRKFMLCSLKKNISKSDLENHTAKDALILFFVHFLLKYSCNIFRK